MDFIVSPEAPAPGGHYSHAVVANGFVFLAGQLPLRPGTASREVPDGIEAQTLQTLRNVEAVLRSAGCELHDVVNVTVYITDITLWSEVNRIFAEVFGDHRPARTMAVSPQLHFGSLLEMQVVACRRF